MTETAVAVVDSSKFRVKIAPDVNVSFDRVVMTAHCPDPYSITLTMDTLQDMEQETNADKIRAQLRGILTHILSAADAERVDQMMADPAYPDTTPDTIVGMFHWLLNGEDPESPKWGKAIQEYLDRAQSSGAPKTRRVAAKKSAAPAKKVPAKKAAAKRAATAAARAQK